MGPVDDSANHDGPRKASEWLVALEEEPDNALLRARFDAWLAASQAHAADWAEITHTVDVLGRLPAAHQHEWGAFAAARRAARAAPRTAEESDYRSDTTSATQYAPRPQRHRYSGRITRRRTALRVAMAAIAACLVLFFGPNLVLRLQAIT